MAACFAELPECDHPWCMWTRARAFRMASHAGRNVIIEAMRLATDKGVQACREQVVAHAALGHTVARPVPKAVLSQAVTGSRDEIAVTALADACKVAEFLSGLLRARVTLFHRGQTATMGGGEGGSHLAWNVDAAVLARLDANGDLAAQIARVSAIKKRES